MKIRILFASAALVAALPAVGAEANPVRDAKNIPLRERISFDRNWRFQKGDPSGVGDSLAYRTIKPWLLPSGNAFRRTAAPQPEGAAPGETVSHVQPAFEDAGWRMLDLPHDWGIEGPFDQELPGETAKLPWAGVGWYRKSFDIPGTDKGKRILLDMDGAMACATVWCNGRFVGGWPYGYASWQLDLTPFIEFGGSNTLAIRVDNPPESSRWYPGSGIYRHVWLEKVAPLHVAHWGVAISTPDVSPDAATVKLAIKLENSTSSPMNAEVLTGIVRLVMQDGTPVREPVAVVSTDSAPVPAGESTTVTQTVALKKPVLWSPSTPHLYLAVVLVVSAGNTVDSVETSFGVRTAEFTRDDGFLLNGERLPIRGVCLHHDLGAIGAAFNRSAAERVLRIMKDMGVNAIRTSHNPPAPELLDLADRMGFLVMDELVDTWRTAKKRNDYHRLFDDWAEADLRAMIRRDRNHPSVVLWSIGNEIAEQDQRDGPDLAKWLTSIAREEDFTRPVTMGVNSGEAGFNGFQKALDVFGYNYKPQLYARFRENSPKLPLYGSETASTISSRGEYVFPVDDSTHGDGTLGQQVSSYDLQAPPWATTPDEEWRGQDANPSVAGEFIWTGIDYLGEPTPFNTDTTNLLNYRTPEERAAAEAELRALGKIRVRSRSSYFAPVDLAGFPKDRFYLYQSHWRPDLPMAHILPHWNWPDRFGQVTPVFVYTSGDEAELFLNGRSLGRRKKGPGEYRLRWNDVKYEPGELKAVAYQGGREWAEAVVKTAGPAAKLVLEPEHPRLAANGDDLLYVKTRVLDTNGLFVPTANVPLHFEVSGPATVVATDNGDATDLTTFSSPDRKSFNGLALAILRAKHGADGNVKLSVRGEGLQPATIDIPISR